MSNVVDIRLSTIMHAVLKISLPKNDRALTKPTRNESRLFSNEIKTLKG